jgi:thymidylate synthase (FAD)
MEMYKKSIVNDFDVYKNITEVLEQKYIKLGMDEKGAEKKAIEDARFALPNACETKIVMTIDARNLINFFEKRCCNRAQWEVREVAIQMLDLVLEVAPNLFAKAGAKCVFGKCPEGKMSCGEKQEPREKQKVKTYER